MEELTFDEWWEERTKNKTDSDDTKFVAKLAWNKVVEQASLRVAQLESVDYDIYDDWYAR